MHTTVEKGDWRFGHAKNGSVVTSASTAELFAEVSDVMVGDVTKPPATASRQHRTAVSWSYAYLYCSLGRYEMHTIVRPAAVVGGACSALRL